MISRLPVVVAPPPDVPTGAGPDHPMRLVTREVAFDRTAWTNERKGAVAELFDGLAADWNTRDGINRNDALVDALDRGGHFGGSCLEIGSGTGLATRELVSRFTLVVALDISFEMIVRAPAEGEHVLADAADLPFPNATFDTAVLNNALLFPSEVDRVLKPGGSLLWVNSLGDRTPIYLSADDVEATLPGSWDGVSSTAGWGTWTAMHRVI